MVVSPSVVLMHELKLIDCFHDATTAKCQINNENKNNIKLWIICTTNTLDSIHSNQSVLKRHFITKQLFVATTNTCRKEKKEIHRITVE